MESMGKDVECTFDIRKRRWRILKAGICCHGVDVTNEFWLTCCELHNMLLDKDNLSEEWKVNLVNLIGTRKVIIFLLQYNDYAKHLNEGNSIHQVWVQD